MAEQEYDLMHKDDVVASLQLDDLSGAILKVTPSARFFCSIIHRNVIFSFLHLYSS